MAATEADQLAILPNWGKKYKIFIISNIFFFSETILE